MKIDAIKHNKVMLSNFNCCR